MSRRRLETFHETSLLATQPRFSVERTTDPGGDGAARGLQLGVDMDSSQLKRSRPASDALSETRESRASPVPIPLLLGQGSPRHLTSDPEAIYFTTEDAVVRADKTGEHMTVLEQLMGPGDESYRQLAVDCQDIYIRTNRSLRKRSKDHPGHASLLSGTYRDVSGFALGQRCLYMAGTDASGEPMLVRMSKGGAGKRVLVADTRVGAMVADNHFVYYTEIGRSGLFRVSECGDATPEQISDEPCFVLAIAGSTIHVASRSKICMAWLEVSSMDLRGGRRNVHYTLPLRAIPGAMAHSPRGELFVLFSHGALARRSSLVVVEPRGLARVLATSSHEAAGVAADDHAVYYTEPDSGRVMKLWR